MRDGKFVIMFVCTGNTCRSPMAHGILESMVAAENLANVTVVSSGTGTLDGYPATAYAVQAAGRDGVDISGHHSQAITKELVEASDLILALAYRHYRFIVDKFPGIEQKVFMLRAFPDREASPDLTVQDPIGMNFDEYLETYEELKRELRRAWPAIRQRIGKTSE